MSYDLTVLFFQVYVINIMDVGTLDRESVIIERRYSQFHQLHKALVQTYKQKLKTISFPSKTWISSKINNSIMQERCRTFATYLNSINTVEGIHHCTEYEHFFHVQHLMQATELLTRNDFEASWKEYEIAYKLLKKLGGSRNKTILSLCGIIECLRSLDKLEAAGQAATLCLQYLEYDLGQPCLFPVMKSLIEIRKKLKICFEDLQDKFKDCQKRSSIDVDSMRSLRELCVILPFKPYFLQQDL